MATGMDQYFERCLSILERYQWLHNFKMTEFFIRKPWTEMPEEWLDYCSLQAMPYTLLKELAARSADSLEECPDSLKEFLIECEELASFPDQFLDQPRVLHEKGPKFRLSQNQRHGLARKKVYEIERLTPVIKEWCDRYDCQVVIDMGCGKGHLSEILVDSFDLKVLGVESDAGFCSDASSRSSKWNHWTKNIRYANLQMDASEYKQQQLEHVLRDLCNARSTQDMPNCLLVSLHGCGDLQSVSYQCYSDLPFIKAFMGIGCCYHKMAPSEEGFANFPLCHRLKTIWNEKFRDFNMNKFSLRVAAQNSLDTWRMQTDYELRRHTNCVGFRALIELMLKLPGAPKIPRHFFCARRVADLDTFIASLKDAALRLDEAEIRSLHQEYEEHFRIVEPFTMLQSALGDVIGSMVVTDRYWYLRERGFACSMIRIFDPMTSPLYMLICAAK